VGQDPVGYMSDAIQRPGRNLSRLPPDKVMMHPLPMVIPQREHAMSKTMRKHEKTHSKNSRIE
jgi:hypothetical protein